MLNIGIPGLALIFIIAVIIFGPSRLPQIGQSVGKMFKTYNKFRKWL